MTMSQVAAETGLSRATARRFLHTLVQLGYMATDGSHYWLRPRILELGYSYLSSTPLPELAMPHLKNLTDETHDATSVGVLDGRDIVYVARVHGRRMLAQSITVGMRLPAYISSMGRVLLADLSEDKLAELIEHIRFRPYTEHAINSVAQLRAKLDEVRAQGWAVVDQELELGVRAIAVPIRDRQGRAVAALNIAVGGTHGSMEQAREQLLSPLLATADEIGSDLQATQR
jgi:IclR family pca regulon transcriptional regulator